MIKAVFLDLDNTLLTNPDREFTTLFLKAVSDYCIKRGIQYDLPGLVLETVNQLQKPIFPTETNLNKAIGFIGSKLNCDLLAVENEIHAFFVQYFESMKSNSKPVANTHKLVESLLKQELKVAIATNPIYPEEAVLRKLQWAGLGTLIDSFSLISHASNTHFVKPSPAYYAELVACVGVEPDEVVMVGDRLENDIIPAQTVGINTFQIQSQPAKTKYSRSGTLEQFHKLIQSDFVWRTPSLSLKINMIEPQLLGNVAALLDTVEGVPSNFWQQHPEPDEWSMQQIVCHLWESEVNVQRPRLQRIGEEDDPFLIAPKPPSGPAELICDLPPHQYIERFIEARKHTLQFLNILNDQDWHRPAHHSVFGPTTLLEMAYFTAQHDRLHINQLCKTRGLCK